MSLQKQPKTPKLPKCKICKKGFVRQRIAQKVCSYSDSPECAKEFAKQQNIKDGIKEATKQRKEHRKAKEAIKTRAQWMKEAQAAFNAFIRLRDADKNCISSDIGNVRYVSGVPKQTAFDAGHYRSVGACPELRFCELNVHKQTVHDNQHLHGNLIQYRIGLIKRIGIEKVEWIEGPHDPKKYTIDDLKAIKAEYKLKLKELLK